MARYTTDSTVTIPQNATNIIVTVAGARGGSGGSDGNPGGSGGPGRVGRFYFPSFTTRTLTLRIGSPGGNGIGCVTGGGQGGGGSSNVASGGSGGRTGPQGCSGGGGGGGGASGVFDSLKNGWVIIAAGGGGGGGGSYPDSFLRGGDGGGASGFGIGNVNSPSNGGTGSSQGFDGGGGGGGGGGCPGGGGGREGADDRAGRYPSGGGGGGSSGYDSNYVSFNFDGYDNNGSGFIDVDYTLVLPTIDSFTANPSAIIQGQSSTLSWTTSTATTVTLLPSVGNVALDGSTIVSPQETITYTLVASGYGITVTRDLTLIVYIPPEIVLSLSRSSIIVGQCATLSWQTTGDADTISIGPGISNQNLTSSATVCPTQTTTYSATVSGLGGSDSDSIVLTVYYPPTVTIDAPLSLDYGQQGFISYTTQYSNISVILYTTHFYLDGTTVQSDPIQLTKPNSAEINSGITEVTEIVNTNIAYTEFGPRQVTYTIQATGSGGSATASHTVEINIDATPDNIAIEETEGKFKSQDPVYTPDIAPQDVIESQLYYVEGVDVAVEIKSNQPIQVDLNQEGLWRNIREI